MKQFYILILLLPLFSVAQEKIGYKTKNQFIEFKISNDQYLVKISENDRQILKNKGLNILSPVLENYVIIKSSGNLEKEFSARKMILQQKFQNKFLDIEPILIYKDGTKEVCTGELIIKVNNNKIISKLFNKYSIDRQENEFVENQFLIKIENITTRELFQLVNDLQKNKEVVFAEPNFIRFIKPTTNDPFFDYQWALKNQGYLGGTTDADMDVVEAWQYSTGQNIKVAVLGEGVDLTHTDLNQNLLIGFDATGNNSNGGPNENNDDAHGTSCAGIIAGVANNNDGVAGVAYNSKVIPVRIAYSNGQPLGSIFRQWITQDSWTVQGINWAVQNGADILSNSWSGGNPSISVTNAINNAITNGRNQKGCIVLFSTGNTNNNTVPYPSNLNKVIAVGASSMCDERKSPNSCDGENLWGSNYGNELDLIAPGVKIYTTDISGSAGYNSGDYKSDFHGTSAACPNAAGVVALILSINPNLYQNEVREILESTTDKPSGYNYTNSLSHPNGSWNIEVGYGRVNALQAVEKAILSKVKINGPESICNSTIYTLNNLRPGMNVNWSASGSITIPQNSTGSSVSVTVNNNGNGKLTAVISSPIGNRTITKIIKTGTPVITAESYSYNNSPNYSISPYYSIPNNGVSAVPAYVEAIFSFEGATSSNVQILDQSHYSIPWSVGAAADGLLLNFDFYQQDQWIVFQVSAISNCGTSTYNVAFYSPVSGGGYMIYPNPADTELMVVYTDVMRKTGKTMQLKSSEPKSFEIILTDVNGNILTMENSEVGEKQLRLDTQNIPEGIYFLQINDKNQSISKKVIVSH